MSLYFQQNFDINPYDFLGKMTVVIQFSFHISFFSSSLNIQMLMGIWNLVNEQNDKHFKENHQNLYDIEGLLQIVPRALQQTKNSYLRCVIHRAINRLKIKY